MDAFVRLIYAIRDNSYIFIAVIFLYIVMQIFFNLIKNVKVREENVFDIKSMTDEERKTFYYTLLNTKLNKDNLDKAEVLSKKLHQEIFGTQFKSAEKIRKRKVPSNKRVNFTRNIYHG